MNIDDFGIFTVPGLGDAVNGDLPVPNPGGSENGAIWQSIGPGLELYVFPDGTEVVTDEAGNIIG